MVKDERRRQRKLAAKRHKEKARQKVRARQRDFERHNPSTVIARARDFPIHECLVNPLWRDQGLVSLLLSRREPDGRLAFGVYLVDIFCLGVKDAFCNANVSPMEYEHNVREPFVRQHAAVPCPIDLAHTIVYGAIDYAAHLGFSPHRDFQRARHLLEPREAITLRDDVEFGQDGEPVYVAGPYDDVNRIMRQLETTVGFDRFKFLVPL